MDISESLLAPHHHGEDWQVFRNRRQCPHWLDLAAMLLSGTVRVLGAPESAGVSSVLPGHPKVEEVDVHVALPSDNVLGHCP